MVLPTLVLLPNAGGARWEVFRLRLRTPDAGMRRDCTIHPPGPPIHSLAAHSFVAQSRIQGLSSTLTPEHLGFRALGSYSDSLGGFSCSRRLRRRIRGPLPCGGASRPLTRLCNAAMCVSALTRTVRRVARDVIKPRFHHNLQGVSPNRTHFDIRTSLPLA